MRPDWQDLLLTPVLGVDTTAFAAVVIGLVVLAIVVAVGFGLAGRDAFDQIGRGGLWSGGPPPAEGAREDQREEEIRQLLGAREARRARRPPSGAPHPDPRGSPASAADPSPPGRAPAPAEPAAAPPDPGLADELRQLALARNVRRRRRGLEPLDVDAEVTRRLRED